MSYARFAVYSNVHVHVDGTGRLLCRACRLAGPAAGNASFPTTARMIGHLREHQQAGHQIPPDTIPALRRDAAELDRWARARRRKNRKA